MSEFWAGAAWAAGILLGVEIIAVSVIAFIIWRRDRVLNHGPEKLKIQWPR